MGLQCRNWENRDKEQNFVTKPITNKDSRHLLKKKKMVGIQVWKHKRIIIIGVGVTDKCNILCTVCIALILY